MHTRKAVITHALRTPLGGLGGSLAPGGVVSLGVELMQRLLKHSGLKPDSIERVWLGQARPEPEHPNVAGIVAYRSGIPMRVSACTLTQGAASGLQAIMSAAQAVLLGEVELALAGGLDCPSALPQVGEDPTTRSSPGGLWCALLREPCGAAAEHLAARFEVSPEEMRSFAEGSLARARSAKAQGRLDPQIGQVHLRDGQDLADTLKADEYLVERPTPEEGFPFKKDGGLVPGDTVAPLADGGAAVVVMSMDEAMRRGLRPLAVIGQGRSSGSDPRFAGLAAIDAVHAVCGNAGIRPSSFDLVELGETFAVDAIVTMRELGLDPERVNVNGGDLALGHSFGATSARMVVALVHEMARRECRKGLVSISTCGGIGMAASFYRFHKKGGELFAMPSIEEVKPARRSDRSGQKRSRS